MLELVQDVHFFGPVDTSTYVFSRVLPSSVESSVARTLFCSRKAKSRPLTKMEWSPSPAKYWRCSSIWFHYASLECGGGG